jgi:hypothetical protein
LSNNVFFVTHCFVLSSSKWDRFVNRGIT